VAELSVDGWQPSEDAVATQSQRLVSSVLSDCAKWPCGGDASVFQITLDTHNVGRIAACRSNLFDAVAVLASAHSPARFQIRSNPLARSFVKLDELSVTRL